MKPFQQIWIHCNRRIQWSGMHTYAWEKLTFKQLMHNILSNIFKPCEPLDVTHPTLFEGSTWNQDTRKTELPAWTVALFSSSPTQQILYPMLFSSFIPHPRAWSVARSTMPLVGRFYSLNPSHGKKLTAPGMSNWKDLSKHKKRYI